MNINEWSALANLELSRLKDVHLGYPMGEHFISPPASPDEVRRFSNEQHSPYVSDLRHFFSVANGADLPDIYNGYFLHKLSIILDWASGGGPTKIRGALAGEVVVFGSDGGGGLFGVRGSSGEVLYLPKGEVEGGVYNNADERVRIVASSFLTFLERLLEDIRAFINGEQGWKYLSDP